MKIDDTDVLSSSLQSIARSAKQNGVSNARAKTDASSVQTGDAISLNSQSLFADALTAGEGARTARIAQLRETYVVGQQTVDSQDLSQAILNSHLSGL